MNILIVDDSEAIASVIQQLLENEHYSTMTAQDGEDGYLAYLHFKPDLVITDIEMPRKNGFELMKDIRSHNPEIKTIYMSGFIDRFRSLFEEEKKRYHAVFLEKPFSSIELIGLVRDNDIHQQGIHDLSIN